MRQAQDDGATPKQDPPRDDAAAPGPEAAPAPALKQCQRVDQHFWKLLLGGALKKGDPS
jgi:hypothetical protein